MSLKEMTFLELQKLYYSVGFELAKRMMPFILATIVIGTVLVLYEKKEGK